MRYFLSLPPPPARSEARIQMSELPAMRNEAQAIARLQNIFPSVEKAHLHAVLRSWGAGGETTPMRPWGDRVEHAVDFLIDEGEIAELDSALLAAPPAAPAAGTSRGALEMGRGPLRVLGYDEYRVLEAGRLSRLAPLAYFCMDPRSLQSRC